MVIFGTFVTVVTFGTPTPVAFWYIRDTVAQCLGHWAPFLVSFGTFGSTLAHFTFGTPAGTLCWYRFVGTASSFLAH